MQRWINVVVTIDDESFNDAVWSTNDKEALIVAGWNWETASHIEIVGGDHDENYNMLSM